MIRAILAALLTLPRLSAQDPALGSDLGGLHWTWVAGHYEGVSGHQVVELDPFLRTWRPHPQGWPSLATLIHAKPWNLWWDGFELAGITQEDPKGPQTLHVFFPERGREPAWFPKAPLKLKDGERVLAAAFGKALIRRDFFGAGSSFAPSWASKTKEVAGHVLLELMDLTDGHRTEVARLEGEPISLEVNRCIWNGELYFFTNHGEAWRWAPQVGGPTRMTEDFFQAAAVELALSTFWEPTVKMYPRFIAFPFFDRTGRILLAMEGFFSDEPWDGADMKRWVEKTLVDRPKDRPLPAGLRMIVEQPYKEGTKYPRLAQAAIFLAFDPDLKKWEQVSPKQATDLLEKNPDSKGQFLRFKYQGNTQPFFADQEGNIVRLGPGDFRRQSLEMVASPLSQRRREVQKAGSAKPTGIETGPAGIPLPPRHP
jgi:hypothetical protein